MLQPWYVKMGKRAGDKISRPLLLTFSDTVVHWGQKGRDDMAKGTREERTIFCSGPNWEGDGSKATSACKFGESMKTTSERYKCSYCAIGQIPEDICADADGVRKSEPKKALKNESQVQEGTSVESMVVEEKFEPVVVEETSDVLPKKKAKTAKKKRRRF